MTRRMPSPFTAKVVGVSFLNAYPGNIHRLKDLMENRPVTSGEENPAAVLVRNPDNEYDSNAIEVHVPALGDVDGFIGHIMRPVAARLAPELDDGNRWSAEITECVIHPDHPDRPGIVVRFSRVEEETENE